MVRELYESHARPFTRVVQGVPMSWDQTTAAITCPSTIELAVWSPCDRFIATTWEDATAVDVLDSVTLQRLQTLEFPQDISTKYMALVFSPDSRVLSSVGHWDKDLLVVSWDRQTGIASVVRWEGWRQQIVGIPSITYSANGGMVAVFYGDRDDDNTNISILISDVATGVRVDSHSIDDGIPLSKDIWTHGGSLRFATADATTITIWEVGFTSGATPTQVETLPTPGGFDPTAIPYEHDTDHRIERVRFLHAPCRLALVVQRSVMVWDVRNSKCLLQCTDTTFCSKMSFSSDGRFFACSTEGSDVYLWKESPTGYILHGVLVSRFSGSGPPLSRNGESIAVFGDRMIRLWRTKGFTAPPSSIPTLGFQSTGGFVLDFSPDGMLVAIARKWGDTVTVLDLKSGVPQLTIDTSTEICGLGVTGNTVVVIGSRMAITWNLSAGDPVPGARVGVNDSSRTINLDRQFRNAFDASISSDSRHIVLTEDNYDYDDSDNDSDDEDDDGDDGDAHGNFLCIYSASTGGYLGRGGMMGHLPRFSPDGHNIWCANDRGEADVWRVGDEQEVLERLEQTVDIEHPPEGYPWGSSGGYRVTDDWWILGPDRKRLLMLPPPWQSDTTQRLWKGRFLVLVHDGLPEPVILELDP